MDWNKTVKMTVPMGLCGWQQRGSLTINGLTKEFPVGVETELPEPVAERIKALIADAEEKAEHVQLLKPWQQFVTGEDGVAHWSDRIDKPGSPHQYLTTDGNGKPHWEDKLAYEDVQSIPVLNETTVEIRGHGPNLNEDAEWKTGVSSGDTGVLCLDGVSYAYTAESGTYGILIKPENGPAYPQVYMATNGFTGAYMLMLVSTKLGSIHTVSITKNSTTIKTIDTDLMGKNAGANKALVTDENGEAVWSDSLPEGVGGGMLTVNVKAAASEDGESLLITSHSHSAQEILEAVEAGMNAQAIVSTEDMGNMRLWLPLTGIVSYGETADDNIIFSNLSADVQIIYDEDNENWTLQLNG